MSIIKRLGEIEITAVTNNNSNAEHKKYDMDVTEAKEALLQMIDIMPSPLTERDPKTRAAVYWNILKIELSPCSITKVCQKVLAGYVGDPKWLPAPGVLIRYAKENWIQLGPVEFDPRLASPRLAAPEYKRLGRDYGDEQFLADERERVARQLKSFAAELQARSAELHAAERPDYTRRGPPIYSKRELAAMDAGEREKQRIEAEDWLANAEKENRASPIQLSQELRAKLGCGTREVAAE